MNREPNFCEICTKRYYSPTALARHRAEKHKGYIPKAVRARAWYKFGPKVRFIQGGRIESDPTRY